MNGNDQLRRGDRGRDADATSSPGKLKAFGVTTAHARRRACPSCRRSPRRPACRATTPRAWIGYAAPAGTPREIAAAAVRRDAEGARHRRAQGAPGRARPRRARPARPRRWRAFLQREQERYGSDHQGRRTSRSNNRSPRASRARSAPRSSASIFRKSFLTQAIRKAFLEHQVVFFRDQKLDPAQFMAFARRMGKPVEYPFVKGIEGFPEVIEVKKLEHEQPQFRRHLALGHRLSRGAADGLDAARARGPALRRRHAVRQPVPRLRGAVGRA